MYKSFLIISAMLAILLIVPTFAQIPQVISFQGRLADASGTPVSDGSYFLTFRLYESETGGSAIWTEIQNVTTANGLFSVMLGSVTPFGSGVDFSVPLWLSVEIGSEGELSPRYQFGASPYAFVSILADSAMYSMYSMYAQNAVEATHSDTADIAYSVSWDDITDMPAGFADGVDDEGSGGGVTYVAGDGIDITDTVISVANGGITTSKIADNAVATDKIADEAITGSKIAQMGALTNQVLKWNGTVWAPANDETGSGGSGVNSITAGSGLTGGGTGDVTIAVDDGGIEWNHLSSAVQESIQAGGGAGDNWGSQVVQSNATLDGDGTSGNPLKIAQQSASDGQVLKWNSAHNSWEPADDIGGGAGDDWGSQVVQHDATLTGDGTTGNELGIAASAVGWDNLTSAVQESIQAGGGATGLTQVYHTPLFTGTGEATNPLDLADDAVTTSKIADANVTPAKIDPTGGSAGQVLKIVAGSVQWANDEGGGGGTGLDQVYHSAEFTGTGELAHPLTLADDAITDEKIDFSDVTLSDFTNDAGFITSADDGDWTISGSDMYSAVSGNVGIGTTTPGYPLTVTSATASRTASFINTETSTDNYAVYGECSTTDFYGFGGFFKGGYKGVQGEVIPIGSDDYFGVYGNVSGGSGTNYGVYGHATGTGTNYGVYGKATGSGINWAGYFEGGDVYIENNLGIGAISPGNKLEITGTGSGLRFTNLTSASPAGPAGTKVLSVDANGDVILVTDATGGGSDGDWTISGTNMYSGVTGNIGIGTTTPTAALHLNYAGDGITSESTIMMQGDDDIYLSLLFRDEDTGHDYEILGHDGLYFSVDGSDAMVVDNNGKVGIGTDNPDEKLHIDGGTGNAAMRLSRSGDAGAIVELNTSDNLILQNSMADKDIIFNTNSGGLVSEKMRIQGNNGYVGIGTASPDEILTIDNGSSDAYVHLKSDGYAFFNADGGTGNSGITFQNSGITKALVFWDVTDKMLEFSSGDLHAPAMVIDTTGNVGIGTTSPDAKLEVTQSAWEDIVKIGATFTSNRLILSSGNAWASISAGTTNRDDIVIKHDNGFVGIGTTTPEDPLYVKHTVTVHSSSNSPTITGFVTDGADTMIGILAGENGYQGVYGYTNRNIGYGVKGEATASSGSGVYGYAHSTGTNYGIYGSAFGGTTNWAGYFNGDVNIIGTLSKGAGSFLIDHPLDPLHKTLRHNFVESPENLCLYRGKVALGSDGTATVTMPDYFAALTKENEATVILTPIGRTPFLASYEWNDDFTAFTIYGKPDGNVSYEVLADRDDPVMHQLYHPVVETKGNGNGWTPGKLLYPKAYGYPEEMGQDYEETHQGQQ